ncbi:MAG TPA: GNAT family N-acetyltransferase [Pyrinomonadaceae bacterium]|nr:GNAT family N-acetyltransferase [Pyrinomonadaceae bacterium]
MTSPASIVFRDIRELSEFRQVERLQKTVWGVEDLDILPALAMKPLVEVGGILIGAFLEDKMIGFVFGFPGRHGIQHIIHSDMLAVLPEYRSFGLGFRLKLAQRERALENGIETITWTFDPLRAVNANLNFARLGVTASRYEIDYYGETSSVLHRLGTDRLWVTWELKSKRTIARIEADAGPTEIWFPKDAVSLVAVGEKQQPISNDEFFSNEDALIEIPTNLDELLKQQPTLAADWRMATRKAFTQSISAGYVVHDFLLDKQARKGAYFLTVP